MAQHNEDGAPPGVASGKPRRRPGEKAPPHNIGAPATGTRTRITRAYGSAR
jgi:hypothetical protein